MDVDSYATQGLYHFSPSIDFSVNIFVNYWVGFKQIDSFTSAQERLCLCDGFFQYFSFIWSPPGPQLVPHFKKAQLEKADLDHAAETR